MERFLAIHRIPEGTTETDFRVLLERLARAADEAGIDVSETVYSLAGGQAFSLVEADDAASVRHVASAAGIQTSDVVPANVVYTELLNEPRRAR